MKKLLLALCCSLLLCSTVFGATFGRTDTAGTTSGLLSPSSITGFQVTSPGNGNVDSISVYIVDFQPNDADGECRFALYSDNGSDYPYQMLGISDILQDPVVGWNTLPLVSPTPITIGTKYWIVWVFDALGHSYTPRGSYVAGITYAAFGAYSVADLGIDFPAGASNFAREYSAYATYTPSAVAPTADFSASPVYGRAPLTVAFTDLSTESPTSWLWDFGDGETSILQNPTHKYLTGGAFDVSLTATNASGSDTETKLDYISALSIANSRFWYGISPVVPPPAGTDYTVDANCVAAYLIETGSGTSLVDASANGINGTFGVGGAAPTWSSDVHGLPSTKSLSFDGGDTITAPDHAAWDTITTNFTVCFWYKFNGAAASFDRVVGRQGREWQIIADGAGTTVLGFFNVNYNRVAKITLTDGVWTHCAWTYDTATNKIIPYLNGVAQTSYNSANTDFPTSANGVDIGHENSSYTMKGSVDEIGIFSRTLSPTEIAEIYTNGLKP